MTEQPPHMSHLLALAHPSFHSCLLSLTFLLALIHLVLTCLPITTHHLHVDIVAIHHCPPLMGLITTLLCLITALLHLVTTLLHFIITLLHLIIALLHLVIALPFLADTVTILPPLEGPVITLLHLVDPITACPHPAGPLIALPHLMNLFIAPPLLMDLTTHHLLVMAYLIMPLHVVSTPPLILIHPHLPIHRPLNQCLLYPMNHLACNLHLLGGESGQWWN